MKFAQIILDIPTAALDAPYTYAVPETAQEQARLAQGKKTPAKKAAKKPVQESFDDLFSLTDAATEPESEPTGFVPIGSDPAASEVLSGIQVGCAVLVPFGGRKAVGFVVCVSDRAPSDLDTAKLKAVEEVLGKPCFTEVGARCAQFLADRYLAPFSSCIRLFMPLACLAWNASTARGR